MVEVEQVSFIQRVFNSLKSTASPILLCSPVSLLNRMKLIVFAVKYVTEFSLSVE